VTTIWAIHRAPHEAPERFAVVAWHCERGASPRPGDPIYVATVELGRAAMPPGLVRRDDKPPVPRPQTGKLRRRRARRRAHAREMWLPGPFPPADEDKTPPPAAPRARSADPDSIVEVWEAPT
jgi:hypothetical protein